MNYLLTLRYNGSCYHGWQRQENAITVQECVENAVEKLFNEKEIITVTKGVIHDNNINELKKKVLKYE